MTKDEYLALKATFPWSERIIQTPRGGFIQVFDKNGNEVSLLAMVAFLSMITHKLAQQTEEAIEEQPT